MKKAPVIILAFLFAGVLAAQSPKPSTAAGPVVKDPAPAPIVIPIDFQVRFFKAKGDLADAQNALHNTKEWQALQANSQLFSGIVGELNTLCGAKSAASLDAQGYPACVLKPEPTPASPPAQPGPAAVEAPKK